MTAIIILIYIVFFGYLVATLPVEGFRQAVVAPVQLALMTPIYFVIAVLFYRVSRRLSHDDPRRQTVLLVSAGWFIQVFVSVSRGALLGYSEIYDGIVHILLAIGWVLVFYGMILGKAART